MFEHYVRQLKGESAMQRRQAIVNIVNSGHADAVTVLTRVVREERDPGVKAVAQKGLAYLKQKGNQPAKESSSPSASMSGSAASAALPSRAEPGVASSPRAEPAPEPPKPIYVSEERQQRAKGYVNAAMNMAFHKKLDKAAVELRQAIKLNPKLASDPTVLSLAAAIAGDGSNAHEALDRILNPGSGGGKGSLISKDAAQMGGDVMTFLLEMAVIAVIYVVVFALQITKLRQMINMFSTEMPGESLTLFQDMLGPSNSLVSGALSFAVSNVLQGLFVGTIMYFVGVLMGGTGGYFKFQRISMRVSAAMTLILIVLFMFLPLNAVTDAAVAQTASTFLGMIFVAAIAGMFLYTYLVGRVHGFGIGKGCLMVILTTIALMVLSFLIGMLLVSSMGNSIPTSLG